MNKKIEEEYWEMVARAHAAGGIVWIAEVYPHTDIPNAEQYRLVKKTKNGLCLWIFRDIFIEILVHSF